MRGAWIAPAATILAAPPAAAQSSAVAPVQQGALDLAAARGALLYAYDQAAWHATDDMLAKIPDAASRVGGWIVDGPADAPTAVFYDREQPPHAVYEAHFRNGALVESKILGPDDDRTLSASRLQLIRARGIGLEAFAKVKVATCSKAQPNTVVLPPDRPGGDTLVYLLTPQPDLTTFALGGNFRVAIAADDFAGDIHAFAKSCLMMSPPKGPGKRAEFFFTTHLLDPVPTELHVFTSLAAHMPIAVMTISNKKLWLVDGTTIRAVDSAAVK